MSDYNSYPYLEAEDAAFCRAWRLSEDKFLDLAGGLKLYTQHRLDRAAARRASKTDGLSADTVKQLKEKYPGQKAEYSVPSLPTDLRPYLIRLKGMEDVGAEELARQLVSDQMTKVRGIVDAMQAVERLQANAARAAADKESSRQWQLREFAKEGAAKHGWKPDSQSAKDYAEAEMSRRGW
jgi:hypothetical protein